LNSEAPIRVVLYCRESANNGNLSDQKQDALKKLSRLNVIASYEEVINGEIFNFERFEFEKAVNHAREENAVLVAATRDRFIRSRLCF